MRPDVHKVVALGLILVTSATLYYLYSSKKLPGSSRRRHFNISGDDTLVFLHIQKTSGSHFLDCLMTAKLNEKKLCTFTDKKVKRAKCLRPGAASDRESWIVSERTLGWICGVHPSYSEMRSCLPSRLDSEWGSKPSRRLLYMTMIRHPVFRYLSEYLHVKRGASWSRRRTCLGKEVTDEEMAPCYDGYYAGVRWTNSTIESFAFCDTNWANNRQTLALTDLERFGCFNRSTWKQNEVKMLNSAMSNLRDMAFFGLAEYQEESEALFKETFNIVMNESLGQKPFSSQYSYNILKEVLTNRTLYQRITRNNHLDMELYRYALKLFTERLNALGIHVDIKKVDREILSMHPDSILVINH